MSLYNYVTTAQPPTAVHFAVKGNFLDALANNLIISKGTRIEIYVFVDNEIKPVLDFPIYGRIESLIALQLPGRPTCSLFVLTDRQRFCVLSYDQTAKSVITDISGALEEVNARTTDEPTIALLDPENKAIIVSMYTGLLRVIPIIGIPMKIGNNAKGKAKDTGSKKLSMIPHSIRISELVVKSIVCLHGRAKPTIAMLAADYEDTRSVSVYELNLADKSINERPIYQINVDTTAYSLVPVPMPFGGFLIISEVAITYHNMRTANVSLQSPASIITAANFLDNSSSRVLLGDVKGSLYELSLASSNDTVHSLHLHLVAELSTPSAIVPLNSEMIYIGSSRSDSCLARVDPLSDSRYTLHVLEEFPNIGPVTDFCLFDLDKQGRQTMVCCSGIDNQGSLRIVQSGVGFREQAVLQISNVKDIWSLRTTPGSLDDMLVLTCVNSTRILRKSKQKEPLEELRSFSTFSFQEPTLATGCTLDNDIVQVTPSSVRLMSSKAEGTLIAEWKSPDNSPITVARLNGSQCVLCHGLNNLVYLEIQANKLLQKGSLKFNSEIAALDITPPKNDSQSTDRVIVGLWANEHNLQVVTLPAMQILATDTLLQNAVPRSIVRTKLENSIYCFVSLGDGQLVNYQENPSTGKLQHKKHITLGTRAVKLYPFDNAGQSSILATSDQPTIITSMHGRLTYSAVDIKNVSAFTTFATNFIPGSIIMALPNALLFGDIDKLRRLHISKIPLENEMGRRIVYHEESETIALSTSRSSVDTDSGFDVTSGSLRVFDARTFQVLYSIDMKEREVVESLVCANLDHEDTKYVIAGTAIVNPDEPNQDRGRLLIFHVSAEREYRLIESVDLPGVLYDIKPVMTDSPSIVIAVNGSIYYLEAFEYDASPGEKCTLALKLDANILALSMDTRGHLVLVGDLMQSMSLLEVTNDNQHTVKKVAMDFSSNWMTAVKILDNDIYLGAEMCNNLFTLKRMPSEMEESTRLEVAGEYHLGDQVNRFRAGSLADMAEDTDVFTRTSVLYATVNGAIGVIVGITQEQYEFLAMVQNNLARIIPSTGDIPHQQWRAFNSNTRNCEASNYIDGDLIERFLLLDSSQKLQVLRGDNGGSKLQCPMEELQRIIETLARVK
ncbi:CPSF A subunit region-domain-containing protein [Radiomyces spectabilis]|uniref:CPSF A subunit region-domain-containing protein n=1 Tax=Radiomyces spectabilis TaxID=64574 RepID=UPI00221F07A5|nr:CPSF A subunit region-domain-containing protein [Radiomyces spectabilis]KAI8369638.1 CPSF A subunit region-domain-containing protein [Radiomyces spectabilis]